MCRLTDAINVGCFHAGHNSQLSCICYLSRSKLRQTPYLCTAVKYDRGEIGTLRISSFLLLLKLFYNSIIIEVPCDRIIAPLKQKSCSRTLFLKPSCEGPKYSLIYHVQTQSCICRETMNKHINCFNLGFLIIDDDTASTTCS